MTSISAGHIIQTPTQPETETETERDRETERERRATGTVGVVENGGDMGKKSVGEGAMKREREGERELEVDL